MGHPKSMNDAAQKTQKKGKNMRKIFLALAISAPVSAMAMEPLNSQNNSGDIVTTASNVSYVDQYDSQSTVSGYGNLATVATDVIPMDALWNSQINSGAIITSVSGAGYSGGSGNVLTAIGAGNAAHFGADVTSYVSGTIDSGQLNVGSVTSVVSDVTITGTTSVTDNEITSSAVGNSATSVITVN